VQYI